MGKTIVQKILKAHSDGEVEPGKIAWIKIDVRSARDFGGPNVVRHYEEHYKNLPLDDPGKTFFTFDLVTPARTIKYAINQAICRKFAREHEVKVFDVDRGIGTHVLVEEGIIIPGVTAVGTDSHYNIVGAVGAFGQGMGDLDIAFIFRTGKTWFEVPETVKIKIKGFYEYPTTAKDLTLFVLKHVKTDFALGKAIEFEGGVVESLPLYGRITLLSMVTEMGGIVGYIPMREETIEEIKRLTGKSDFVVYEADPDAVYSGQIEIDVKGLKPQIAAPPHPHNVFDVSDLKGEKVDLIYVGSCTNGRREDIEAVARILKGKRVKDGVILTVTPTTRRVYGELLKEGILEVLYESGAIIGNPGCAGCAEGHPGLTGEGEVSLNTSNRNFPGKQGKGRTFLVSPLTAAASAITGVITSPEEVL